MTGDACGMMGIPATLRPPSLEFLPDSLLLWPVSDRATTPTEGLQSSDRRIPTESHSSPLAPHPTSFALLAFLLVLVLPAPAQAEGPMAVPVDGEPFRADLSAVDQQWQITLLASGAQRVLRAASLVSWGRCAETGGAPLVVLADGSLLAANVRSADREYCSADSALVGTVRLPRQSVAGVLIHPPAERDARDRLVDRALSSETDRVLLINGDDVSGAVERIGDGKIRLQSGVGPLELETGRVAAILCRTPAAPHADAPGAYAGFRDGTCLRAASLTVAGNAIKVTLANGLAWNMPAKELVFLQPWGGQAVYLSDLKPEGYRHVPYLSLSWPYRADRNVLGGMLRAGNTLHVKGLGMHSASRLSYALAQPYRRFQAELAVDDQTGGGGSVGFRVFVDGQVRYTSPIVRGGQTPLPVSIDVAGGKRIDLVVDFADRGDELDHADWLNARLVQ